MTTATWIGLILVGICLKFWLLWTSQSMPDGDEAVEGLMAMYILLRGEHPIYPYGVNYGAGAGWEAHLAAGLFAITGPSEISLKLVGLIHYLVMLGFVAAIALFWRGRQAAMTAAGLFAMAPQTAQWALKTSGGHQIAVILALAAFLLGLKGRTVAALILLPLAALAHPIVLPFAAMVGAVLIWSNASQRRRIGLLVIVLAAGIVEFVVLCPPVQTVWNPVARSFNLPARLMAIPRLALGLFCPNLNSVLFPTGWRLAVAFVWLAAVLYAACQRNQPRWNLLGLLAPLGIIVLISSVELAPRHILIASPMAIIVLACGLASEGKFTRSLPLILAMLGCGVQIAETANPCINGPGVQSLGVNRENFWTVMRGLRAQHIQYVYSTDPMLPWNIMFASREQILARQSVANDRVPGYVIAVDEARRSGKRVALVTPRDSALPPTFGILLNPPSNLIDGYFQPAPMSDEQNAKTDN